MILYSVIKFFPCRVLMFVVLTLRISQALFSQDNSEQTTTNYSINSTFSELHELESAAMADSRIDELNEMVEVHLQKAKKENDAVEVARAFYYKILTEEPERALVISRARSAIPQASFEPLSISAGTIETAP